MCSLLSLEYLWLILRLSICCAVLRGLAAPLLAVFGPTVSCAGA